MYYLALVHRDVDAGGYGFTIPDIMGFTAHGETDSLDEAIAVARRILADHIAALVDAKLPVPVARAAEIVLADPDVAEDLEEAMATILLPAIHPAGRTVRINISIDESTLALADSAAHDRNLTRSAFVAEACRRFAGEGDIEAKDLIFRIPASAFWDAEFQTSLSNVCRGLNEDRSEFAEKSPIDSKARVSAGNFAQVLIASSREMTARGDQNPVSKHPRKKA